MSRVELPPSRLRARRRRMRYIIGALVALAILLLCGGLVAFAHAPFIRITKVEVIGEKALSEQLIAGFAELKGSYFYLLPENNIFLYPKNRIVRELLYSVPKVKSAEVHAVDFQTIAITVVEREPVALWCEGRCSYMDEDGMVYAPVLSDEPPPYIQYRGSVTGTLLPQQYLTPTLFHSLTALVGAVQQTQPQNLVGMVVVDDTKDVRVYFQKDFLLIFALGDAGGDVFERFTLALKAEPFKNRALTDFEYLDLRWGDKLYYKLKGE